MEKKEKVNKENDNKDWGEVIIPLIMLSFCFSYIYQVIGVSVSEMPIAVPTLIILIPLLLIVLFNLFKNNSYFKNKQMNYKIIFNKLLFMLKNKQFLLIIIFLFSFFVISPLFGFIIATFLFLLLTLIILKPNKLVLLILPLVFTSLIYIAFSIFLNMPLPEGIFDILN